MTQPGGKSDYSKDPNELERARRKAMGPKAAPASADPWQAAIARQDQQGLAPMVEALRRMFPGMSDQDLMKMASEGTALEKQGGWMRPDDPKLKKLNIMRQARTAPADPAGGRVRDLLQPAGPPQPFLANHKGFDVAPNPAYGQHHGLVWDGNRWAPKQDDPDAELKRLERELEMQRLRRELAAERAGAAAQQPAARRPITRPGNAAPRQDAWEYSAPMLIPN